jgi:Zn finger protein HypA/HybF involved in hydrogenase expression
MTPKEAYAIRELVLERLRQRPRQVRCLWCDHIVSAGRLPAFMSICPACSRQMMEEARPQ